MFLAPKAPLIGSLGQRPRDAISAESANQSEVVEVNRAFSAGVSKSTNPGALPQASGEILRLRR
jgi:hypothetical protein